MGLFLWFVFLIYTIFISILHVSQERFSLAESNQQIRDHTKLVIFESWFMLRKVIFLYQSVIYSV